jgi:hypothetical protein
MPSTSTRRLAAQSSTAVTAAAESRRGCSTSPAERTSADPRRRRHGHWSSLPAAGRIREIADPHHDSRSAT